MKKKRTAVTVLTVISIVLVAFSVLMAGIFCLVGFCMSRAADSYESEFVEFMQDGAQTTVGEIVYNSGSGTTVRYVDYYGDEHEASFSVSHSKFQVGNSATVYYSESNPDECMFPDLYEETYGLLSMIFTIIGAAIGGFFFLVAAVLFIISRVLNKKKQEEMTNQLMM